MHTQSYKAYLAKLEATGIGNTNVDVDVNVIIWTTLEYRSLVKAL